MSQHPNFSILPQYEPVEPQEPLEPPEPSMPLMPQEPVEPPLYPDYIIRNLEAQLAAYEAPNAERDRKIMGCAAVIAAGLLLYWLSYKLVDPEMYFL
jgi:hypothetical protein